MRIGYSVLVSLATLGCILAQEQNSTPQQTRPENPKLDYFTQPQFRPLRPFVPQNGLAPQEAPLAKPKPDFKVPVFGLLRRLAPQNRMMRPTLKVVPDRQNLQSESPLPCAIPLLQAQIPKDIHFTVRQFRPRPDQLGPMPTVKAPAPSCDDKSGPASSR
jgi:hypothetical protein